MGIFSQSARAPETVSHRATGGHRGSQQVIENPEKELKIRLFFGLKASILGVK